MEFREEGRTLLRYVDDAPVARSDLPCPHVITDEMPPTEQVDGVFYTSKRKFRAVGRALGLIEMGNEKHKPFVRASKRPGYKEKRRADLKKSLERYRAGHRPRRATDE